MLSPGGHNPEYSEIQILQWKKAHTVISGCDSQKRLETTSCWGSGVWEHHVDLQAGLVLEEESKIWSP